MFNELPDATQRTLLRLDARLVAPDQRTGQVVWAVQAEPWQKGFSITSAPLYYDGMVITCFSRGETASRGRVKAFGAKDGEVLGSSTPCRGRASSDPFSVSFVAVKAHTGMYISPFGNNAWPAWANTVPTAAAATAGGQGTCRDEPREKAGLHARLGQRLFLVERRISL